MSVKRSDGKTDNSTTDNSKVIEGGKHFQKRKKGSFPTYNPNKDAVLDRIEDLFYSQFCTIQGFHNCESSVYNQPRDGTYLVLFLTDAKHGSNFPKQFCGVEVRHEVYKGIKSV